MNNNILDDNYRKKFIDTADYKSLNDYLKYMERLSKKGGKYLEIYTKDMDYLLNITDLDNPPNNNVLNIFMCCKPNNSNNSNNSNVEDNIMSEQPCDTEGYVNKINNICLNNFNELKSIKQNLGYINTDFSKYTKRFIDITLSINDLFNQSDYSQLAIHLNELVKIITHDDKCLREAFMYLGKALNSKKDNLSDEFMKKCAELRSKKQIIGKKQYNSVKNKMISDYIIKIGFQSVYISKLVEKVISVYKNRKQK